MAPDVPFATALGSRPGFNVPTVELAWINQASRRHCHFGLKSAPQHRDFRPGKEGVV
jgi:hypothetical protein